MTEEAGGVRGGRKEKGKMEEEGGRQGADGLGWGKRRREDDTCGIPSARITSGKPGQPSISLRSQGTAQEAQRPRQRRR